MFDIGNNCIVTRKFLAQKFANKINMNYGLSVSFVTFQAASLISIHDACCMPSAAMTNLKFGSCTTLSSSSPMIEASKLVTVKVDSWSRTPSL